MTYTFKIAGRPPKYNINDLEPGDKRVFDADPDLIKVCMFYQAKRRGWTVKTRKISGGCEVERTA